MRRLAVLSAALLAFTTTAAAMVIHSVALEGSDAQIVLKTRAGDTFDDATVREDVRALYATGRFSDVRVEAQDTDQGRRVVFQVIESPRLTLRTLRTSPEDFRFKAEIPAGTPIDHARSQLIANEFRRQLSEQGYSGVFVRPEIQPLEGAEADLVLHVAASEPLKAAGVELIGEPGLDKKEVLGAIQALKGKRILPGIPGLWEGWTQRAAYTPMAEASDIARVKSLYLSRGYFDATVRADHTDISRGKATLYLGLNPGMRYDVRRWEVTGEGIDRRMGLVKEAFRARDLCDCLFDLRREAEKQGILDFSVQLAIQPVEGSGQVDLLATVQRGPSYRVRRIEFQGNKRFSDGTIRGNMLLDEMDLLDSTLLRKSLHRLNRSSLFEPVDERNIEIATDQQTGLADVRIRIKERKFGSWLLSGPVGPMSVAGPLQFTLASRLPAWGRGIFELSSWYANFSLLGYVDPLARIFGTNSGRKLLPVFALQRPFIPSQGWTSGLTIAPQLGWRGTLLNYGSNQFRERVLPWLSASERVTTVLPVTVITPTGESILLCEPPEPRLKWLRKGAAIALQFATAAPIL